MLSSGGRLVALLLAAGALALLPAGSSPAPVSASTFIVDSTDDATDVSPGDGICAAASGACTLRAAVQEANALAGADAITLPAGTYTLTIAGTMEDDAATGDLDITEDVTLTGAGAADTIVDGGALDRVFHILSGASVEITATTITNGSISGLRNEGTLALTDSAVAGNTSGGGAGGVDNDGGVMSIVGSTISENTAFSDGGGIRNSGSAALMSITNSTISGNATQSNGGGIVQHVGATLQMNNVTITNNVSNVDEGADGAGGGLKFSSGTVRLKNTIIAGNIDNSGVGPDCVIVLDAELISEGYNLIGNNSVCSFTATTGDQIGTGSSPIDPLIGTLQDNGGPTLTHAIPVVSPAIDAANPAAPGSGGDACEAADQRGDVRPADGDSDFTATCDIGAFEFGGASTCPIPDLPLPGAGCIRQEFNAVLLIKAPEVSPETLTCNLFGQLVETHSAVGDSDEDGLDDIQLQIIFLSGFLDCPGPIELGSSIPSIGFIEEKTNLVPGSLEFPANGEFILCISADTYPLGVVNNCPEILPVAEKFPLQLACNIFTIEAFECDVAAGAVFFNEAGEVIATVNTGAIETSALPAEPMPDPTPTPTSTPATPVKAKFDALLGKVAGLAGPPGLQTSLGAKLNTALRLAQGGNPCASVNVLGAFTSQVKAQTGGMIPPEIATLLIDQAQSLVVQLLQGASCPHDPDMDGDLLGRSAELVLGTDPGIADTDGDTLDDGFELLELGTNPLKTDTDLDGCSDGQELGASPTLGGQRDPRSFWDFMDQWVSLEKDGVVNIIDIGAVVARFGSAGDPSGDPLDPPTALGGYHVGADRTSPQPGANVWNAGPPDGSINIIEIGLVVAQFGHICA